MQITWIGCAAPNFRKGRAGHTPEAIVIHIVVGSLRSCDNTFLNPSLDVRRSAHYGVGRDGRVHQYVADEDTAFHAGIRDREVAPIVKERPTLNPNLFTIGIEHEGFPGDPWPDAQFAASAALVADVARRWGIPVDRRHVILHREIRASKTCPGSWVDIDQLVARAAAGPALMGAAPERVTAGFPRDVRLRTRVNLRSGRPSTVAPIVVVLPAGGTVQVSALVRGGAVASGTSWWCEVDGGTRFCWAGACDVELPG